MSEYTPIKARRSKVIHAISLRNPGMTVCKRTCNGWAIALGALSCKACKAAVHLDVMAKAELESAAATDEEAEEPLWA